MDSWALKWWRKTQYPDMKHPKSYPLEHFIGDCCPDGITSVAEGIVLTLENIVSQYPTKPFLADRGVPEHDVFARITDDEYSDFYDTLYHQANNSKIERNGLWRKGALCLEVNTISTFQSEPYSHAKCNFRRGSDGLKKFLDTVWNQGQYYLGEWHYHPNASSLLLAAVKITGR